MDSCPDTDIDPVLFRSGQIPLYEATTLQKGFISKSTR